MKVVKVTWQDHYSVYGWHGLEDTQALGHLNISAGFLIEQNNEHTTLAQTTHSDGTMYGDLLHIMTKNIIKMEEFT